MPTPLVIEVAVATIDDALTARDAGADRLELNAALALGGLTPSLATLRAVRRAVDLPVIVMIRPRAAGFAYSAAEFRTMRDDAEIALAEGAAGIAFGMLRPDRSIDIERTRDMVRLAAGRQTVFHRAFDVAPDPFTAMESLIDLGVTRILTSGRQRTAPLGADLIAELVRQSAGRIEILPGAGIRPENVAALLARTGSRQVHGSFSDEREDPAGKVCDAKFRVTRAQEIRAVREAARAVPR